MSRHDEGFFSAKDNLRLFWQSELPEGREVRAHVAVVHGYAEHFARYRRFAEALCADGFAVHGFDYRGHGQADGKRGFCHSYAELVDDLELFWGRVQAAAGGKKSFLFAHSNGGLMALLLLGRAVPAPAGVVLSAPFLELAIQAPALKVLAGRVLSRVLPWVPVRTELTPAHLTRDPEEQRKVERDPLYFQIFTPRYITEAESAQAEAFKVIPSLRMPAFVLCGAEDSVVSTAEVRRAFESLGGSDKKYKEYAGMRHEPLNELGRDEVQRDISSWISAHL